MKPSVWFVTPVHKRLALTEICLEQRRRMLDAMPLDAQAVITGDDENMDVARALGLHTVEIDNEFVGAKFNAGYRYAVEHGATHCMAIGSDSWLHPDTFSEATWSRKALGIIGLSSISPCGEQRLDLEIKYPAGFGVGMCYPAWTLGDDPCEPRRQRGIDTSTWGRVGRGHVEIEFLRPMRYSYTNFHSGDVQITEFRKLVAAQHRRSGWSKSNGLDALEGPYDSDLVQRLREFYAASSVGIFFAGRKPALETTRHSSNKPNRVKRKRRSQKAPLLDGPVATRAMRSRDAVREERKKDMADRFRAIT
jgi:hypothetical protein